MMSGPTSRELARPIMADIVAWLRANDIDPNDVPEWAVPTVASDRIVCTVYLRNANGAKHRDSATGKPAMGKRIVQLKQAPPPALQQWLNAEEVPK